MTDEQQPTEPQPTEPPPEPPPAAKRLFRSREDRVIAGVCGGIARYFGIDPVIVRIVAVVTAFFGGAGLLAYIAALLLVPDEDGTVAVNRPGLRGRAVTVIGIALLVAAAGALVPWGWHWAFGGTLFFLALVAVLAYARWTLASGERPERTGDSDGNDAASVVRTVLLGLALLAACGILALGAGWGAAVGGDAVVAGGVIFAGALLVVGAFVRPVRWLIAPALALALPLAVVAAADINVDSSVGDRDYRPLSVSELRASYELGMGRLLVDLRGVSLPAGDRRLKLKVGVGEAVLLVPEDVCVASRAKVGIGQADLFSRGNGGVDVDVNDLRQARPDGARVVLDANVGIGHLQVSHDRGPFEHFGFPGEDLLLSDDNIGCANA